MVGEDGYVSKKEKAMPTEKLTVFAPENFYRQLATANGRFAVKLTLGDGVKQHEEMVIIERTGVQDENFLVHLRYNGKLYAGQFKINNHTQPGEKIGTVELLCDIVSVKTDNNGIVEIRDPNWNIHTAEKSPIG